MYRSLQAADHADDMKAAFTTEGKPLIPASLMAITNGDFAAVETDSCRSLSVDGTSRPTMKVPPM